jgi:hypothetical protein
LKANDIETLETFKDTAQNGILKSKTLIEGLGFRRIASRVVGDKSAFDYEISILSELSFKKSQIVEFAGFLSDPMTIVTRQYPCTLRSVIADKENLGTERRCNVVRNIIDGMIGNAFFLF